MLGSDAPILSSLGTPESIEGGVTIEVKDNEIATCCIVSLTVLLTEMGGAPAVASLHPTEEIVDIYEDV